MAHGTHAHTSPAARCTPSVSKEARRAPRQRSVAILT